MRMLRIGTRASTLARWQTDHIARALEATAPDVHCEAVPIVTRGDTDRSTPIAGLGEVGVFTEALERALQDRTIDLAVHSLKDLPTTPTAGLVVAAVGFREDPRDVLVSPAGATLATLHAGARIGTSSLRRQAQLLAARPDVFPVAVRGNVETRVRRAGTEAMDAVILAAAGLRRLRLDRHVSEVLPVAVMMPAPGQGALAVQCRADDVQSRALAAALDEPAIRVAVEAERAFLSGVGGGCSAPVGALGVSNGVLRLEGLVAHPDGSRCIRVIAEGPSGDHAAIADRAAREALSRGAAELLA
ncbi:MAG: hydroxymethylbilane synthase [Gemmatimonadales bacterium]